MTYTTLIVETIEPHILKVILNRPDSANAFNTQMATELYQLFEELALVAGDTRCIVLSRLWRARFLRRW